MPDILKLYEAYAANTARFPALYEELASQLGVSAESVCKIGVGFLPSDEQNNQSWIFPERNANGDVIGLSKRLRTESKYMVKGSKRGLAYAVNTDTTQYEARQWTRVSADHPCPLCDKPDGCLYPEGEYDDPNAVICVHIATGAAKPMKLGHLHILDPARQKLQMQNYSILLPSNHPVLVVEGASDVCAAYDLGFTAVGKPSAASKSKDLIKLLTGRDVVVMGENDAGAGKGGMDATFDALRNTCSNLTKLMPPKGVKDLRQWVEAGLTKEMLLAYIEKNGDKAPQDLDALCDDDTAERFVAEHKHRIRFNRTLGKWMNYDGQRWSHYTGEGEATRCYTRTTKKLWAEALNCKDPDERKRLKTGAKHAKSAAGLRGALAYVKSKVPIDSGQEDYNKDDYLLNCLDCTVDLRTGEPHPHNPNDMITLLAPVNYYYKGRPKQPTLWFNGLDRWHSGEKDTIDYLQQFTGMCCTGDISSRVFSIFHGDGKNGKSVFLDTIRGILGDYAGSAARTLLTMSRNREHSTELADLSGKRLVIASETKKGDKLRAELVKSLTGDKYLKARFMRKDFFEFIQTAKAILVSNHLPTVDDTGEAIWDRFHYLKWAVKLPKEEWDTHLTEKLKDEWTGILRWAIAGCLKWQEAGALIPTEAIRRHTEQYRKEQDPMPEFLQHCAEPDLTGPGVPVDYMYHIWRCWCSRDGSKPGKKNVFLHDLLAASPDDVHVVDGESNQTIMGIKTTDRATKIQDEGV